MRSVPSVNPHTGAGDSGEAQSPVVRRMIVSRVPIFSLGPNGSKHIVTPLRCRVSQRWSRIQQDAVKKKGGQTDALVALQGRPIPYTISDLALYGSSPGLVLLPVLKFVVSVPQGVGTSTFLRVAATRCRYYSLMQLRQPPSSSQC